MSLPTLYKTSNSDATQTWSIHVEDNVIVTRWGQIDGAIQETRDVVVTGKNLGKKNATTPAQQAAAEAAARHEKKRKKGYVTTREAAAAGEVDAVITGGVAPMLAHRFDEQGHKLTYPCYAQPKLDGHRCLAVVDGAGKCTLWSRTRKPITSMGHVVRAIEALGVSNVTYDGELYAHDYRDKFEALTSMIRATEEKPGVADIVEYHIYDVVHPTWPFGLRSSLIDDALEYASAVLVAVVTESITDEDDLMLAFDRYRAAGYEGAMARNAQSKYVNKRSYDLLKVKEFLDAEFLVVGVEEGRGKLAGHAIFVCRTDAGVEFRAKMTGALETLKPFFDHPETAIGRWLTVKYQGITTKNGVPRFPVGLRFAEEM
jgi:DNA ligase-1